MIIYDATRYANKPALGLPSLAVIGEAVVTDKASQTVTTEGLERIRQAPGPVCVDIETWTDPAKYLAAARSIASVRDDWGFYMMIPQREYWPVTAAILQTGNKADARVWKRRNNEWKAMAAYVGVAFPSLYTFYNDRAGWKQYAIANICEARRIAPGKKIIPLLWPQYHDSNPTLKGTFIDKDFFKLQLTVSAQYADAVAVWDWQPGLAWSDAFPWWQAYQEFKAQGGLEL